jgi:hypothetical protein
MKMHLNHLFLNRPFLQSISRTIGIAATALMLAITVTGCEPEDPAGPIVVDICPPGHPCQNPPANFCCTPVTAVTVENVGCGVGVWGAYWFRTDNGDLLQPWLSNMTAPINPGERYLIDFGPAQRDHLYDSVITCMALVPMGTPVRINCMQAESVPQ